MSEAIEKTESKVEAIANTEPDVKAKRKAAAKPKAAAKAKPKSEPAPSDNSKGNTEATQSVEVKAEQKPTPKSDEQRADKQRRNARRRRQMSVKEMSGTRVSTRLNAVSLRSHIADDVPSMSVEFSYSTSFMHKFMSERGDTVMQIAERLAATMRMLAQEPELYYEFEKWNKESLKEAKSSLKSIRDQREVLEQTLQKSQRDLQVNTPDKFVAKFVFTTGLGRQIIEVLEDVDNELSKAQYLYFAGKLNDLQLSEVNRQGLSIINSYIDRAFKITSPGKRESGRFQSSALAEYMKSAKADKSASDTSTAGA